MSRISTSVSLPLLITMTLGWSAAMTLGSPAARAQGTLPAPAAAPPPVGAYNAPPAASIRSGWNVGFGLGGGDISCEGQCDGVTEAGSVDLHVGTMVRPRLNVVGTIWAMRHAEDQWTLTHTIVTAGLQYWIIGRLWVHGGIGFASARLEYDGALVDAEEQTENVFGIAGGIGFEILSHRAWTLDVALRGGKGFYDDVNASNSALTLDLTWY